MLATIHRTAFLRGWWVTLRVITSRGGGPQPQQSLSRSFRTVVAAGATESSVPARTIRRNPSLCAYGYYRFEREPAFAVSYHDPTGSSPSTHRSFSSSTTSGKEVTNETPEALVLKVIIGDDDDDDDDDDDESKGSLHENNHKRRPLVLMPPSINNTFMVDSVESIIDAVNKHYTNSSHFVGGMGEQDPGVWFAPGDTRTRDLLADATTLQLLGDAMDTSRTERHGIPFAVFTSGVDIGDVAAVAALKWDSVQVSLWAATPKDYTQCTGGRNDFGQVCGFIAQASEMNVPVEVGVLRQYAGPATSLALSLGARRVHVYDV